MRTPTVTIINYEKGNLANVAKILNRCGAKALISATGPAGAREISRADALILPGVGSFADAMAYFEVHDLVGLLLERIRSGLPFLGICLGHQLLFASGDEGSPQGKHRPGLGILPGRVVRINAQTPTGERYKVPHVGWNQVDTSSSTPCPLFAGIPSGSNFYFTHSYVVEPSDPAVVAATTTYADTFASAVCQDNVFGLQFHPEKSARLGARLLANFVELAR
jgi:glutamine amidotransferase